MADGEITNAVSTAEQALGGAALTVAEGVAGKALGPAGTALVDALGPEVLATLITGLHGLFTHIGVAVTPELAQAKSTVDKWTGGLL